MSINAKDIDRIKKIHGVLSYLSDLFGLEYTLESTNRPYHKAGNAFGDCYIVNTITKPSEIAENIKGDLKWTLVLKG